MLILAHFVLLRNEEMMVQLIILKKDEHYHPSLSVDFFE